MFDRLVCGIDGSAEALEAARQSAILLAPGGEVLLVSVIDGWDVVQRPAGETLEEARIRLRTAGEAALAEAAAVFPAGTQVETRLTSGPPAGMLEHEADRLGAGLVAIGAHGTGRMRGIVLGSVATALLHRAPCPVLLARRRQEPEAGLRTVVVGYDGSEQARRALATALDLARLETIQLRVVVAQGAPEPPPDLDPGRFELSHDPRPPLTALLAASEQADLLLIGSRGLHGVRALGSVSERLAHRAACSVLVIRGRRTRRGPDERLTAGDVMTQPVVAARDDATLEAVARLMVEHDIGAVPIVDQDGELRGIVTESDFVGKEATLPSSRYGYQIRLPRLFGHWLLPDELETIYAAVRESRAADVMSTPVVTATESEPLQSVVERMVHYDVNRIPVVRDRKPVGMIARHDLLNLVVDRL